jgi:hypothetical protein
VILDDDACLRPIVQDQFSASAAWGNDGELTIEFLRLRVADGDDGIDGSVAFEQRTTERNGLSADGHATDGRAKMDTSPDAATGAAHRGGDCVPEWLIVGGQDLMGGRDKFVILLG